MLPDVVSAIEEIRANFPTSSITSSEDGEGGAYVILEDVPIPPGYSVDRSWIGFRITYSYPAADVYPHFVRPDLARVDGKALALSPSTFNGRPALQLSRRSTHWDPAHDTAALKLQKILTWMEDPS